MKRILFLPLAAALALGLLAPSARAQTTTVLTLGSRVIADRDGGDADARDELEVTVSIQLAPDAFPYELGTASPIFTFNQAALEFVAGAFEFAGVLEEGTNASEEEYGYSTLTVTNSGARGDEVQVNMALSGSGAGPDVPQDALVLVRIYFKIKDEAATTMLVFDELATEVFQSDNITRVLNAQITFVGEDTLLPVELTDFTATLDGAGGAVLEWGTAGETSNSGFGIEHAFTPTLEAVVSTAWGDEGMRDDVSDLDPAHDFEEAAFVAGAGTTLEAQQYRHALADLAPGVHRFRLKQVDYDGDFSYSPEVEVTVGEAVRFALSPNYPNPFAQGTTMRFSVTRTGPARVVVYDMLGRLVERVFEGEAEAGRTYRAELDGSRLASGQYVVVLTSGGERAARTITRVW